MLSCVMLIFFYFFIYYILETIQSVLNFVLPKKSYFFNYYVSRFKCFIEKKCKTSIHRNAYNSIELKILLPP